MKMNFFGMQFALFEKKIGLVDFCGVAGLKDGARASDYPLCELLIDEERFLGKRLKYISYAASGNDLEIVQSDNALIVSTKARFLGKNTFSIVNIINNLSDKSHSIRSVASFLLCGVADDVSDGRACLFCSVPKSCPDPERYFAENAFSLGSAKDLVSFVDQNSAIGENSEIRESADNAETRDNVGFKKEISLGENSFGCFLNKERGQYLVYSVESPAKCEFGEGSGGIYMKITAKTTDEVPFSLSTDGEFITANLVVCVSASLIDAVSKLKTTLKTQRSVG